MYSSNLREVADSKTRTARTTDKVVSWMLVGISSLVACTVDNFKDCIDSESLMRVDVSALSVDLVLWEVRGIDAAGEDIRVIVIYRFVVKNCDSVRVCSLLLRLRSSYLQRQVHQHTHFLEHKKSSPMCRRTTHPWFLA